MAQRRRVAQKKGFDVPERELVPNYEGEPADSWEGAKEIAKKKGTPVEEGDSKRRPLSAEELKTFDTKIEETKKEKEKKKSVWDSVK